MELNTAITEVASFKGANLKVTLGLVKQQLIGKGKSGIISQPNLFEAAVEIKKQFAQIDEIVHAAGIIKILPFILDEGEIVVDLSLAAGAEGEGFDLVTNKRIAEFKFSRWQADGANGTRKRQVFADFVNLLLNPTKLKKQLFVHNAEKIEYFLKSKRAKWQNVLSKSGGLDKTLATHLMAKGITANCLNDIFCLDNIQIIDIDEILL